MVNIRKLVTVVEEILTDGGRPARRPVRKVAAVAVIANPFAGRFVEDLTPLIDAGEELGALLAKKATEALGAPAESYGKAAIVGERGEYEHAAALQGRGVRPHPLRRHGSPLPRRAAGRRDPIGDRGDRRRAAPPPHRRAHEGRGQEGGRPAMRYGL